MARLYPPMSYPLGIGCWRLYEPYNTLTISLLRHVVAIRWHLRPASKQVLIMIF